MEEKIKMGNPIFFKHEIIAGIIYCICISLLSFAFAFQSTGKLTLFLRTAFTTSFKIIQILSSTHIFLFSSFFFASFSRLPLWNQDWSLELE